MYAQRYLADVTVTALAFQRIGDGLQGGNLQLISAAEKVISQLDTQVQSDAHRYGIPTCPTQGGGASGGPSVPTV